MVACFPGRDVGKLAAFASRLLQGKHREMLSIFTIICAYFVYLRAAPNASKVLDTRYSKLLRALVVLAADIGSKEGTSSTTHGW